MIINIFPSDAINNDNVKTGIVDTNGKFQILSIGEAKYDTSVIAERWFLTESFFNIQFPFSKNEGYNGYIAKTHTSKKHKNLIKFIQIKI